MILKTLFITLQYGKCIRLLIKVKYEKEYKVSFVSPKSSRIKDLAK